MCSFTHHEEEVVGKVFQVGTPIQEQSLSYHAVKSKVLSADESPLPGASHYPLDRGLHPSSPKSGISKGFSQKRSQLVKVRKATEEVGNRKHLLTTHGCTWIAFCKGNGRTAQDLKPLLWCPVP